MSLLARWILSALALILISYLLPGFSVSSFFSALMVALVLGLLNAVVRPILIILTLPINLLTLGLFTFFINAFLLWFVSTFIKGFEIADFSNALIGALILWAISWFGNQLVHKPDEKQQYGKRTIIRKK